ncbi:DNA-directed RNA polymerase subunit beta, partial [Linum perenne]
RIVITQILQSPDIYYQSELDHNGIPVYASTIISDWGRVGLEIDRKGKILALVSRKQKISILVLLAAMSLNLRQILENVYYPEIFLLEQVYNKNSWNSLGVLGWCSTNYSAKSYLFG